MKIQKNFFSLLFIVSRYLPTFLDIALGRCFIFATINQNKNIYEQHTNDYGC